MAGRRPIGCGRFRQRFGQRCKPPVNL
jgi:hypothetical protein